MLLKKEAIINTWMHSHEEDTSDSMIFRRKDYPLPPSRGRTGYNFNADGTVIKIAPGADDRTQEMTGKWTLEGNHLLKIQLPGSPVIMLDINSLDEDCLIVRK
jgi:hypothetical protein